MKTTTTIFSFAVIFCLLFTFQAQSEILNVPGDHETIQEAIDDAKDIKLSTINTPGDANDVVVVDDAYVSDKIAGLGLLLSCDINLIERYQNDPSKMNRAKLSDRNLPEGPNPVLKVFIYFKHKPDHALISQLEKRGFELFPESWIPPVGKHPYGFMVANAEASQIKSALRDNLAERIVAAYREVEPYNDLAAVETGTAEAREEYEYDGEGVRLAIIDTGFELDHPDLPTPDGFVARDYSLYPDEVDNDVTDHQSEHGAHVAGTAFGTGELSEGRFQGMAPGVTPVYLKVGDDQRGAMTNAAIVGAIESCIDEFDVDIVNLSLGGWWYNDGSGPLDQAVDYAVSEGVTIFVAAGNEANDAAHYYGVVPPHACTLPIEIEWSEVRNENADEEHLTLFFSWYDGDDPDVHLPMDMVFFNEDEEEIPGQLVGPDASIRGTEAMHFVADDPFPDDPGSISAMITNNSEQEQDFHLFILNKQKRQITTFTEPSEFYTIGSPAVADGAIAVAAFTSRNEWTNYQGHEYIIRDQAVGELAGFSSRGPRIDGVMKPEITSPGQYIISCRNRDIVGLGGDDDPLIIGNDGGEGEPADYLALQGTSMASPAAAGAAALILQDNPELTANELRELIINNTRTDNFTGDDPDRRLWGHGKLDVMNILDGQQAPRIAIIPSPLDFGEVFVNRTSELPITITNEGRADLIISDITVRGDFFSCNFDNEIVIESGENDQVLVTFHAERVGDYGGVLTIFSNDPQNAEINVDLLGTGTFGLIQQKITASDAAERDQFGNSVSISGDYAIVTAVGDDEYSGSAYVFVRNGNRWAEQAKLTSDDADEGDYFGYSVSISGDYAIVGAPLNDNDGERSGSAYIFVRDGAEWTQQAKLTADDAADGDFFGGFVSICGNYAIVGAHCNSDDGRTSGSAYIFVRVGNRWTQQAKLTADDADSRDFFGYSVSISGDCAIVGAHGNDDDGESSGSAYIFVRDGEEWTQQAKLTADDAEAVDTFGYSVSVSGDYTVIGAVSDSDDGQSSGSAYIFFRDGDEWTQQAKLTADDAAAGDYFGYSVSISGDGAIIGANYNDDGGESSGSAYIFVRDGEEWSEQAKLTADDADAADTFGYSVSISDDYAVIGAVSNDDDGDASGSAYINSIDLPDHPVINVSTEAIDFQNIRPGATSEQTLLISNLGNVELRVEDVSVDGDYFSTDFEDEIVIQPDEEFELSVTFAPEERGDFEGVLTIISNDPLHEETVVSLSGRGGGICVPLHENWNLISINVSPPQEFYEENDNRGPDVILMTDQLRIDGNNHHLLLMKDEDGRFYLPAFGFNNIPYWDLTRGYQVKVDADVEAVYSGEPIPADADIWLDDGWNIIAYFPTYELDARSPDYYVLSPIIDALIMAKDNDGRFMLPAFNFSNMPPWRETQGYQVKVDEDVLLNYPPEQEEVNNIARTDGITNINYTSNNMSLLLNGCEPGQIAALTSDGIIIGIGTVDEDNRCGLAVWGDDPTTEEKDGLAEGESFELKYWDTDIELEVKAIHTGNGLVYETNSFTVIDVAPKAEIPDEYYLSQNYPNPFNSTTRISYGLPEAGQVSLTVYDISGRVVQTLVDMQVTAGHHTTEWEAGKASSGLYLVRFEASNFKAINKVVLAK